jgi:nucleotide-binding universal stress UspA family protein
MASRFTADIILSYARDHGVDLIVIGAYSHARSVEMAPDVAETGACSRPDVTMSD